MLGPFCKVPRRPNVDTEGCCARSANQAEIMGGLHRRALASSGTSLDDRLIFHDDVKSMVLKLLCMVERSLKSAILRNEHSTHYFDPSTPQDGLPESAESATSQRRSFHGLDAVSASLDRLHRLATAIRRSSIESQKDKLLTKTSCSEEDTYQQLTSALIFHRKRLLYGPRHNKKLASEQQKKKRGGLNDADHLIQRVLMRNAQETNLADIGMPPELSQTEPLSKTEASIPNSQLRLAVLKASRPVASIVSVGSSVYGDHFHYPDAPTFKKDAKFHPCPYCAEPLSTKRLGPERRDFWRSHVIRDLEPYVCISDDCRDPLQFFVHFKDWLDHMNSKHTTEWYRTVHMCTWHCNLSHEETQYFDSKARFDIHTREAHANLTSTQIIAHIKRSKATGVRQQFVCPLCETVPDTLQGSDVRLQLEGAQRLLAKHVGSHIKALSLLSFRLVPLNASEQVTTISSCSSNNLSMNSRQTVDGSRRLSDIDSELDVPKTWTADAEQHGVPFGDDIDTDKNTSASRNQSPGESQQFGALSDGMLTGGNPTALDQAVIHHLSCRSLEIGTWRRMDQNTKDLVVFYSPAKARMTYYIKNVSVGYMIEYPFAFITKVSQLPNKVRTKEVRPSSTPSVKSPTVLRFRIDLN